MAFNSEERDLLLAVKGVGPTVVQRLEEYGFSTLEELSEANTDHILQWVADHLKSSCWKNAPRARQAIDDAIAEAKRHR